MKRLLMLTSLLAATAAGAAMADETTTTRDVPAFKRVSINGSIDAVIKAGESRSVTITAEEDHQKQIETFVRGDTLVIKMRGRFNNSRNMVATISTETLEGLEINGSSDARLSGIRSETFEVEINGSGDVVASGECGSAKYETNGSGDIDATKLKCKDVRVEISGSGDSDLYASGELTVSISGSGDVTAYGKPTVRKVSTSGSGSFAMKD